MPVRSCRQQPAGKSMSRMVRITATNASTFLWQDTQWFKSVFILSSVLLKISSRPEKYWNEEMYD
ncbi:hypothetical protein CW298_2884 [Salmonella enterica subsp. enterica serovar Muenchen]|uniref:Multidrug transporter n=93 Tax=Salmonella enterica TaxID=28901 RepID=A0A0H3BNA8_SALNS|nr:hypothetical protein SNSL254_A1773 [Salmonella enterica subsp. enterica serovar Newport str. SL254]ACF69828.1 hypothetical protein SeHA_C1836 [Salmonella enterica subsp. enterica serovar Heidelberg str. SL476]AGQ65089.1 hypothetical protein SEEH1578_17520 [Salmonella enterica subsp. enterica serovar Heidelberg str. 41578]AGS29704.1 hypothetical protein SN31241_27310 [Salmonella enterica subsp. enterica serovar Newport str. USMARC-S3124.1]AHB11961.1 multidrug transporter [Salmonella enterica 